MDILNNTPPPKAQLPALEQITPLELMTASIHPPVIVPHYLYADVRVRIAAGGTGKTTLALYEAVRLALGRELWGRRVAKPFKTALVTSEDTREILVARLREILKAEIDESPFDEDKKGDTLTAQALGNIAIYDLTGKAFRVSKVAGDMVKPDGENLDKLIERLKAFEPDWIIFDPLVSFGVGESRVNDAEQGVIEAFRIIRNEFKCCVEGIHHTGKAAARDKIDDQYAGRGGSALADGARMVAVLNTLNPCEWAQATGGTLSADESGLVMSLPKLSYCKPQQPIFIRRSGYGFEMVEVNKRTPAQEYAAIVEQVYQFLSDQYRQGRKYSKADIDAQTETLSLRRNQIRMATSELIVSGRIIYHEVKGKSGSHYEPIETAKLGGGLSNDYETL